MLPAAYENFSRKNLTRTLLKELTLWSAEAEQKKNLQNNYENVPRKYKVKNIVLIHFKATKLRSTTAALSAFFLARKIFQHVAAWDEINFSSTFTRAVSAQEVLGELFCYRA